MNVSSKRKHRSKKVWNRKRAEHQHLYLYSSAEARILARDYFIDSQR